MTELLIVKSGTEYCRFLEKGFELCEMNKASVFPLTDVAGAKQALSMVKESGRDGVIMKLSIREELFIEEAE